MATQADLYNIEPAAAGAGEVAPLELEPEPEGAQQRARRQNVVEVAAADGRFGPGKSLPEVPLESWRRPRNRRLRRNVPGGTENAKLSAKRTAVEPRRMATGTIGTKILSGSVLVTVVAVVVVTLLVMLATLDATWTW